MEYTVNRQALAAALSRVGAIIESRNTIPILSNILITARKGELRIEGTDLDMSAQETIRDGVNVIEEGSTTVSAKSISDIVRKLEGETVAFQEKDGRLELRAGRSQFKLHTLKPDDFPVLGDFEPTAEFSLTGEDIRKGLQRVRQAMSTDETRYYLNGVHFHIDEGKLHVVATDGHRLSIARIDNTPDISSLNNLIVPRKAVGELLRNLNANDGEIELAFNATRMRARIGDLTFISKLIDGTYPDYERVVPNSGRVKIHVDSEQLQNAIERVRVIASERTSAVRMDIEEEILKLSVRSPENGLAEDEVAAAINGDVKATPTISFNGRYMTELLGTLEGEIVIEINDANSPMKFTAADRPDDRHVLMPMRS